MSTQEIIEGNEAISDFMDLKPLEWISDFGDKMKIWVNKKTEITEYDEPELKYHSSWDWLMPVVEKIESIHDEHHGYFGVHISSNSCSIQGTNLWKAIEENSSYGSVYMSDPNAIFPTKIESTWYNIVEFIKWYNQTPHQ